MSRRQSSINQRATTADNKHCAARAGGWQLRPSWIRLAPLMPNRRGLSLVCLTALAVGLCGCTSLPEYVKNGFKVGPNYQRPPTAVANDWIEAADALVRKESDDLSKWWTVFNDPILD